MRFFGSEKKKEKKNPTTNNNKNNSDSKHSPPVNPFPGGSSVHVREEGREGAEQQDQAMEYVKPHLYFYMGGGAKQLEHTAGMTGLIADNTQIQEKL